MFRPPLALVQKFDGHPRVEDFLTFRRIDTLLRAKRHGRDFSELIPRLFKKENHDDQ
jgi:hypothetical protein